jgi:carbonic anhydrase
MAQATSPELEQLIAGYRRFRDSGWTPIVTVGNACARAGTQSDDHRLLRQPRGPRADVRHRSGRDVRGPQRGGDGPPFETTPGHHGVSAALEFAIQVLKVKEVVVMGHGMCGGCRAALTQEMAGAARGSGGFVADWISLLDEARKPVVEEHGTSGRTAERAMELAGVKASLANLRTFPWVQEKEARRRTDPARCVLRHFGWRAAPAGRRNRHVRPAV